MPQPYKKKRRAAPGPNKNEKKVMRTRQEEMMARQAGALRDRFPAVQKLSIDLQFFTPQQHLLDQQTRTFNPQDVCDFTASCPGRCGGQGSFDFTSKIQSVLESHQPQAEARGTCPQPLFDGGKEPCGFELRCRIKATYNA